MGKILAIIVVMAMIKLHPGEAFEPDYSDHCTYKDKRYDINTVIEGEECSKMICDKYGKILVIDECMNKETIQVFED